MHKNEFSRELTAVVRRLNNLVAQDLLKFELGSGQMQMLIHILENPGIFQEALSDLMSVDKTTTTKAIRKLETAGYVEKEKGTTDRRFWHLYPTDKAREVRPRLRREIRKQNRFLLEDFTDVERVQLFTFIQRLQTNIEHEYQRRGEE